MAPKKQKAPQQGTVRAGPLMNLPEIVRNLGVDPEPLFDRFGLAVAEFSDPNTEIPFVSGSRLIANCVAATGCDHLGFLLGKQANPSSLGVVGFMLPSAPNVGAALQDLVKHLDLHDAGALVTLESESSLTFLSYYVHISGVQAVDQINDMAMVVSCQIMRMLCGPHWNPTEVFLTRRPPSEIAAYRHFFNANIRFNSERAALAFPTEWLEYPLSSADPFLHDYLERAAEGLHEQQRGDLLTHLRHLLRASIGRSQIGASEIAQQLGIHERSLSRHLREAGTTFRRESDSVRFDVARQLLSDTSLPVSHIGSMLNYADSSAFNRAFRRWSGMPPSTWRKAHSAN